MKCISIKISGKVQGVFFRASTKEQADFLGIKGFVRNEKDGSVYAEAVGDDHLVNTFIEWCKKGPPRASVTECSVEEIELKPFSSFVIIR